MSEYKRLKENIETLCIHNERHIPVYHITGGGKYEIDLIREIVSDCREILSKIDQGELVEIPFTDKDILEDYAHRMFDSWNDITGALHKGCSWYGEALSVIDDIVGMVYGITIRQAKLKELKELQNGQAN